MSFATSPLYRHVGPAHLPNSPAFLMPPLETRYGPGPSYSTGIVPGAGRIPEGLPGPIYPGPGWHDGPAVSYTAPLTPGQRGYSGFGAAPDDKKKWLLYGALALGAYAVLGNKPRRNRKNGVPWWVVIGLTGLAAADAAAGPFPFPGSAFIMVPLAGAAWVAKAGEYGVRASSDR